MRWAVPSSKVGSCDNANAAAERDSGVDAVATGFAAAGLTGAAAVPTSSANAGAPASVDAMATMVIIRMSGASGCAGLAASKSTSGPAQVDGIGRGPVCNGIFADIVHDSCVLIK